VEERKGRHDPPPAVPTRRVGRLGSRALHDGPRPLGRRARGVRPSLREGPHLPRPPHHSLVRALPYRARR
jgi:hypothetical protein